MWTCPRCGRSFANRNQWHACGPLDLERHLAGKDPEVVAIFRRLLALAAGRPGAAGLDVFEREPEVHPGLLGLDNVTIVPHLGTSTLETRVAMGMTAAVNLLAALEGRRPPNLLNPEALG